MHIIDALKQVMYIIFTFSKQALNESLDFCNRSEPHE